MKTLQSIWCLSVLFFAALFYSVVPTVTAETLTAKDITISIPASTIEGLVIEITPKCAYSSTKLLTLTEPSRVVVDFQECAIKKLPVRLNKKVADGFISGVRLGAYPDKIRVVFDLVNGSTVTASIEPNDSTNKNSARLVLRSAANEIPEKEEKKTLSTISKNKASVTTTTVSATTTSSTVTTVVAALSRTSVTLGDLLAHREQLKNSPGMASIHTLKPAIEEVVADIPPSIEPSVENGLLGIDFMPLPSSPEQLGIRLKLSKAQEFRVSKKGERLYELSIKGVKILAKELLLEQFPPQDVEGITFVKATNTDQGVLILIGVERNTKLTAFASSDQTAAGQIPTVWVRKN